MSEGFFKLQPGNSVEVTSGDERAVGVRHYLVERLETATGYTFSKSGADLRISLSLLERFDTSLGTEGYILHVTPERVEVSANTANGLFYGVQTLLQLMPPEIESERPARQVDWLVPCVRIRDYPRFPWRGLLLDVSRHFFTKEELLAYIDQMARYKLNIFHIHLSDDQGWRLQIKRYPKLTDVGAWRVPRTGSWWSFDPPQPGEKSTYGGFYTQDDVREIVHYAAERSVTIVPEIDVPGHSLAALASYPELSCEGGPFDVNPGSKFYNEITNVLCAGKEEVFEFLDGVMTEVADLFPGRYIHMGGDEATKKFWKACPRCQACMKEHHLQSEEELQSYFVKRLEKIIESKGKQLIGWDEILEGGLSPNATVMSWRGTAGGIKAAQMKHPVIMTPLPEYYLDLFQGDPVSEPETYGMCRLKTCYGFEPVPDDVDPKYILGGQGNLWTESVPDFRHAQYMTWPRGMAIAESLWSPAAAKDWASFVTRVERQFDRLDIAQVKYARSMYDAFFTSRRYDQGRLLVEIQTEVDGLNIHYTWAGTNPDQFYPKYEQPLIIPAGAKELRVITYRNGTPVGKESRITLTELQKRAKKVQPDVDESARLVPVDLRPYANRDFADQSDKGGPEGWTGQGSENDFRMIPHGRQHIGKILFDIIDPAANGGKGALILRGAERLKFPAAIKGIKIGGKFKRFFFLHGCGWCTGREAGRYRFHYADGQSVDVPLVEGQNIGDWWNCHGLPEALIGVTGVNGLGHEVGLFVAEWKNPHPEKTIVHMDFISVGSEKDGFNFDNTSTCVPFLAAVTGEEFTK